MFVQVTAKNVGGVFLRHSVECARDSLHPDVITNTAQQLSFCIKLSSPVVSNGYTTKCSGPYWSNPPFKFSDIPALWHSDLRQSAWMSKN